MGKLIDFNDYKKKLQNKELNEIESLVKNLIVDLGIEHTPKPYFPDQERNITLGLCIDSLIFCSDALMEIGYTKHQKVVDNLILQISKEGIK